MKVLALNNSPNPNMESGGTGLVLARLNDVYDAAREAGRQLARDGRISLETLATVSQELVPRELYVQHLNMYFQQALDAQSQV